MGAKELLQQRMRYEMSMNFFRGLLCDGKLSKVEFKKAAKFVDEKYDIENLEIELGKLKFQSMQSDSVEIDYGLTCLPETQEADIEYISLTDIAKKFNNTAPSYVIQSWMRSSSTMEFLNLWEQRHNDEYSTEGYDALVARLKTGTFTMTPKQWIKQTGAVGIVSKAGKNGGTYAHPLLVCEFMMWLSPEYRLNLLEALGCSRIYLLVHFKT
ncbi:KilA-N domain-containing protein [Agathobaculum sp.]|uniref:KilA-N domain-containing protein n=1 Tax=Agathobaculum sp. TaxID=2048138 RepID=UPI002A820761|nr:KilA-N domain-containing protein [Agathobaculum sp.]MDY3619007.1 KilA-N domain-containing protein [Agathobaculum sp.]